MDITIITLIIATVCIAVACSLYYLLQGKYGRLVDAYNKSKADIKYLNAECARRQEVIEVMEQDYKALLFKGDDVDRNHDIMADMVQDERRKRISYAEQASVLKADLNKVLDVAHGIGDDKLLAFVHMEIDKGSLTSSTTKEWLAKTVMES